LFGSKVVFGLAAPVLGWSAWNS